MELKTIEQRYREYLDTLPLSTLRILGRQEGMGQASSNNKDALISAIIDLLTGKKQPAPRSNRGAPVKQTYLDPVVRAKIEEIRRQGTEENRQRRNILEVASGEERFAFDAPVYTGLLEVTGNGYGFIRTNGCRLSAEDIFVPAPVIHAQELREGDFIACTVRPSRKNDSAEVAEILSVNGIVAGRGTRRPLFDTLRAQYPCEKFDLSAGNGDIALRFLDLFVPIGKGQRALVVAPPRAGQTTLLKSIACAVRNNYPDVILIVLLVDERPEEVTEFENSVRGAQIVWSSFDESAEHHVRAAHLVIEHAKRMAEQGKDVFILLDSLTKLTRAHNYLSENCGKTISGGLDPAALSEPKRFFGAARNTSEAGSVTIVASVSAESGNFFDDAVSEAFRGTGNAEITLSRELAERRIFPAFDLGRCGTRKEELLLSAEELQALYRVRESGFTAPEVLDILRKTNDNAQLVADLSAFLNGK